MEFGCHLPVFGPAATSSSPGGSNRSIPTARTATSPLPPNGPLLEPLTTLALVAGATERIGLGTTVLVLPHCHPVLAAKMLATLDHLEPRRAARGPAATPRL